ncbi:hypothetical protein [Herbaspirillum rubrisubalbicans]|uniref:hypothetical protein n=1 Tax=Herbaspirillum rubrisubalbicans TaxID=80842 RepID=UPI0015C545E6|nr:hypothetical protein [Herbaspirillum rubrisubalbicans]NQE50332.1 hypothetical protein [Herbaspirillum rubrisubalbicans]
MNTPSIYLEKMDEALKRLRASEDFIKQSIHAENIIHLESSALQLRKAMEAIAFASIAPNRQQYEAVRKKAEKPTHFGNDWKADSIFLILEKLNPDFYPEPVSGPMQISPGHWHYGMVTEGFLTRKNFEALYKRLGKFLHADNPWGQEKGWKQIEDDIPLAIGKIRTLLRKHRTMIRAEKYCGMWIVDAPNDGTPSRMIQAIAPVDSVISKPQ